MTNYLSDDFRKLKERIWTVFGETLENTFYHFEKLKEEFDLNEKDDSFYGVSLARQIKYILEDRAVTKGQYADALKVIAEITEKNSSLERQLKAVSDYEELIKTNQELEASCDELRESNKGLRGYLFSAKEENKKLREEIESSGDYNELMQDTQALVAECKKLREEKKELEKKLEKVREIAYKVYEESYCGSSLGANMSNILFIIDDTDSTYDLYLEKDELRRLEQENKELKEKLETMVSPDVEGITGDKLGTLLKKLQEISELPYMNNMTWSPKDTLADKITYKLVIAAAKEREYENLTRYATERTMGEEKLEQENYRLQKELLEKKRNEKETEKKLARFSELIFNISGSSKDVKLGDLKSEIDRIKDILGGYPQEPDLDLYKEDENDRT